MELVPAPDPTSAEADDVETDPTADSPTTNCLQEFLHRGPLAWSRMRCACGDSDAAADCTESEESALASRWHNGGKQQLPAPAQLTPLSALPGHS